MKLNSFAMIALPILFTACSSSKGLKTTEVVPVKGPAPAAAPVNEARWTYEGEHGPEAWGKMNPDWNVCTTGKQQSPVDLKWRKPGKDQRSIGFFYNAVPAEIVDNGHTIQVNVQPGSKVDLGGKTFDLVQFH